MKTKGFTIVELLIVIVVIGILAAISLVAYTNIQSKARDSDRKSDIAAIKKALELYYIDNGTYPSSSGSTTINGSWTTSADASWDNLSSQLVPNYMSALPKDPRSGSSANPAIYSGFNYDYIRLTNGWCNTSGSKPGYLLAYRYESISHEYVIDGDCPTSSTQPSNYDSSEYIRVK